MSTVQQYLKKLDITQLEAALQEHCDGTGILTPDTALTVCAEIAKRDPTKPDPWEAFRSLCRVYLPE